MAIDIPSLFRDVIETPEQRQRRKLSEAVALAPQARGGIASLLNPLAQAASINLQQGSEGLGRSVGGMLGLDMRDTSQKVSDELLGADLSSSTGMRDLSKAINRYAPAQAIGLLQAADEREQAEKAAEAAAIKSQQESYLTQLKTMNELADAASRREEIENTESRLLREETQRESGRNSLMSYVNSSDLTAEEKVRMNQLVMTGRYDDSNLDEFMESVNPEANIEQVQKGNNLYDHDKGIWLKPPVSEDGTLDVDLSSVQYDASSLFRFEKRKNEILSDDSLSDEQKNIQIAAAGQTIIKQRIPGEEWIEVEREDEKGKSFKQYISVPASSQAKLQARNELRALNSRNRLLADGAETGLAAIDRIREDIRKADESGDELVGGFGNIIASYVPGTNEFELGVDLKTINSILGLTGLQENREGSATGASGFGQLSNKEMDVLQQRIAALQQSSNREQFLENLAFVESFLEAQKNRGSIRLTYDQYIGKDPEPTVPETLSRRDL